MFVCVIIMFFLVCTIYLIFCHKKKIEKIQQQFHIYLIEILFFSLFSNFIRKKKRKSVKPLFFVNCVHAKNYLSKYRNHSYECGGRKNFRCPICGKGFSQSTHLKRHSESGVCMKNYL